LPCGRCWLDLQRFTVQALEPKGEYYVRQAGFVRNALRTFLQELPALLDQVMSDDTPVANAETRAWINEQVLSGVTLVTAAPVQQQSAPQAAPQPVVAPQHIDEKPPDLEPDEQAQPTPATPDIFEEAMAAAQASRAEDALEIISRQLASERSGRGRFRRRTQLAHLLMMGGHKQIALPILEQLAAEIDQRNLADWERNEALAYPLDLLLRCLDANGSDETDRKQLYARLCRLDPVRALKSTTS
jgi:type VI secretion system protein ImpA